MSIATTPRPSGRITSILSASRTRKIIGSRRKFPCTSGSCGLNSACHGTWRIARFDVCRRRNFVGSRHSLSRNPGMVHSEKPNFLSTHCSCRSGLGLYLPRVHRSPVMKSFLIVLFVAGIFCPFVSADDAKPSADLAAQLEQLQVKLEHTA